MMTDAELERDVTDRIKWEPNSTPAQIGVTAVAGMVTLTGEVGTHVEKWAIGRTALRVPGVASLADEIAIKPSEPSMMCD